MGCQEAALLAPTPHARPAKHLGLCRNFDVVICTEKRGQPWRATEQGRAVGGRSLCSPFGSAGAGQRRGRPALPCVPRGSQVPCGEEGLRPFSGATSTCSQCFGTVLSDCHLGDGDLCPERGTEGLELTSVVRLCGRQCWHGPRWPWPLVASHQLRAALAATVSSAPGPGGQAPPSLPLFPSQRKPRPGLAPCFEPLQGQLHSPQNSTACFLALSLDLLFF